MAAMPELKSAVATAIERYYEATHEPRDSARIGASLIGNSCDRAIWYAFRWASDHEKLDGRKLRLFETGHREEARMVADLRSIGCVVTDTDPATDEQWEATLLGGVVVSKLDGKIESGLPGAEKTPHILECKTMNDKSFQDWRRKGVATYSPVYYAQLQIGMMAHGLDRALFMATNKNTDEVETERVKYDPLAAAALVAKAERVAFTDTPPERNESFACRWCRHEAVCKVGAWPRTNCRTCLHAELMRDGEWRCSPTGAALDLDAQKRGCPSHLFLPGLVPGEQIDADEEAQTVTYKLADGSTYVDGPASKREAR